MEKKNYLIGFRFGKREVIGYDPEKFNYRICRCDCGNVSSVNVSAIKKGNAQSCRKCNDKSKATTMVGLRLGKLTVIKEYVNIIKGVEKNRLVCQCDCGNVTDIDRDAKTKTQSCGCSRIIFHDRERHKGIFSSWKCMMQRCYNKKHDNYKYYGASGVVVQESWHTFINFYNDLKDSWFNGATIDRYPICNGNYKNENVRWATIKEQNRNKTTNKFTQQDIDHIRASELTQTELAKKYKVSSGTISMIVNNKAWIQ